MSVNNEMSGDILSLGSSDSELEHDEDSAQPSAGEEEKEEEQRSEETGKLRGSFAQKRPRDSEDESDGSDTSTQASDLDVDSPPRGSQRGSKRAKLSSSVAGRRFQQSSEEGEIDDSDDDTNPRAALEAGKASSSSAPSSSVAPIPLQNAATVTDSASQTSLPASSDQKSKTQLRTHDSETDGHAKAPRSIESQNRPTYQFGSSTLTLPTVSKKSHWLVRIEKWTKVLCQHNMASISAITPAVVLDAFASYLDQDNELRDLQKKSARRAAQKDYISSKIQDVLACFKSKSSGTVHAGSSTGDEKATDLYTGPVTESNRDEVPIEEREVSSDGIKTPSTDEKKIEQGNKETPMIVRNGLPSGEEELKQQRRYFPSASDPSAMCLLCGGQGHKAMHCARSKCRFCDGLDHWDFCCPSLQQRCGKCRQLGHATASCQEKLALIKEEGLACLYCDSKDHLEGNCTELWRSFQPDAQTILRVIRLPRSCSVCGSRVHFSGDCTHRRGISGNPTWSLRNYDMYTDPTCNALCIEESADPAASNRSLRAPEIKIRGQASRTTNVVHFSETDDSDVEFLGTRAKRDIKGAAAAAAASGRIRMASNIQLPQMMGNHRVESFRPLAVQPPLPPGPPPRFAGQPRAHAPPPPSLPAKPPPASSKGYHNVPPPPFGSSSGRGRGSPRDQRGRGGARGARASRARGRGRGRGGM
ncbi:hypothetical protein E4U09_005466 [Claviceps aff. purpurea]|uniref:CCHC-type domain-containing protein n=1 Tax=Claviceps aff. purpurea TaxID=1967640 RepID=A0A9P7U5Q1_9HYPO|nr:hypothetical protein E4U09_005466 [Claviceps aff. purpurea]